MGFRHSLHIKKLFPNIDLAVLTTSKNKKNHENNNIINKFYYNLNKALEFKPNVTFICNPSPFIFH